MSPEEAWAGLGIYGGDDGLTPDVDPKSYHRAAQSIGQVLTLGSVKRGDLGVAFLARYYSPHVWFGDTTSVCDVPRQLAKLHVTVKMPPNVTPAMKLIEKARAFVLTDQNTPIIGPYVQKVLSLAEGKTHDNPELKAIRPWSTSYDPAVQYPNDVKSWVDSYIESELKGFDIGFFSEWLETASTMEDLLNAPMIVDAPEPTDKYHVVVDGYVVGDGIKHGDNAGTELKLEGHADSVMVAARDPDDQQARFEAWKARKIADGTWTERNTRVSKQKAGSTHKAPKPTGSNGETKCHDQLKNNTGETFEQLRERKIRNGTWKEGGERSAPPRGSYGNLGRKPRHSSSNSSDWRKKPDTGPSGPGRKASTVIRAKPTVKRR